MRSWYITADVFCKYNFCGNMLLGIKAWGYIYFLQVEEGNIPPVPEVTPPPIPEDLKTAIKSGKVRAPTHIISTISDDRG